MPTMMSVGFVNRPLKAPHRMSNIRVKIVLSFGAHVGMPFIYNVSIPGSPPVKTPVRFVDKNGNLDKILPVIPTAPTTILLQRQQQRLEEPKNRAILVLVTTSSRLIQTTNESLSDNLACRCCYLRFYFRVNGCHPSHPLGAMPLLVLRIKSTKSKDGPSPFSRFNSSSAIRASSSSIKRDCKASNSSSK